MKRNYLFGGALLCFVLIHAAAAFGLGEVERGSGKLAVEEYNIRNFDNISVSGSWDLKTTRGAYQVSVEVDDNILEYVRVEKRGDTLVISTKSGRFSNATFRATVSMPELEKIGASGSTSVDFSGFESDELDIDYSGSATIVGDDCTIDELEISGSGSGKTDLKDCVINEADIHLSGSSVVILTMAGGDLSGKISGSGSVTYYGEVDTLNVRTSGSARIIGK